MKIRGKRVLTYLRIFLLLVMAILVVLPAHGDINVTITVASDPAGHQQFIQMPGQLTIIAQVSGSTVTFTGPSPWVTVTGTLAASGFFDAKGTGTVAGFPNIAVTFQGTLDLVSVLLEGSYIMGAVGGLLPGGQPIDYLVKSQITTALPPVPPGCTFSISPTRQVFPASGGSGKVGVITAPGCPWTAASNAFFITVSSGFSGTGSGTVAYTVAQNFSTTARDGTMTIAGQKTFTVIQAGTAPFFQLRPTSLTFGHREGSAQPEGQLVSIFSDLLGLAFTATATTASGGNWLSVNPASGTAPSSLVVSVNPTGLAPGSYQGAVAVTIPNASPSTRTVSVSLTVAAAGAARLAVIPSSFAFPFVLGAEAQKKRIAIFNTGGGSLDFQVTATTFSGGPWLTVTPASGTATLAAPAPVAVTANPTGLPAGTYAGRVTVSSSTTNQSIDVPVTMTVSAVQQALRLSQRGLTFTAIANGGPVPRQAFAIGNIGRGVMNWSVSASTLSGGNWLGVSPTSGSTDAASLNVPQVEVSVNPGGLAAGQYYGQVRVSSPEADNSPQVVSIVLNLLPAGSDPGVVVRPTGLIFTGVAGGPAPGAQTISLSNVTDSSKAFKLGRSTSDGSNWFAPIPTSGTVGPNQPTQIVIQPATTGLSAGIRSGVLTVAFADGTVRTVELILVLTPGGATSQRWPPIAEQAGCAPTKLLPVFTLLGNQFDVSAAWPVPIETLVVDNCGNPLRTGSVVATFSNGDPPLGLESLRDGRWSGTWQARNTTATQVGITVTAAIPGTTIQGTAQILGALQANPNIPQVGEGAVVSAASFASQVPAAPGSLVSIFGSKLAEGTGGAAALPLGTQLANTSVVLGGQALPLLFASEGQINAMIPYNIAVNTQHLLVVQRGTSFTVPEPVTVAPAQPAIFTPDQTGKGQGFIFAATTTGLVLAEASRPAKAGDVVVIFCAGLGAVDPPVTAGAAAPLSPLSNTVNPVSLTIGGVQAPVQFAGLGPSFTGLYQVNAVVPEGVQPGNQVPVILTVAGQNSPAVTMAIR